MTDTEIDGISHAATQVMAALQPLTTEQRGRVIHSMAALFGVAAVPATTPVASSRSATGQHVAEHSAGLAVGQKPMSLVELIKEKQPGTNAQRIACFAYYREKFEGVEKFSSSDLSGYFAKAKLPAPGPNYMRDYNNAVKAAWIHDEGPASYLTQAGEKAVDDGFEGKVRARGQGPNKRKKKVAASQ